MCAVFATREAHPTQAGYFVVTATIKDQKDIRVREKLADDNFLGGNYRRSRVELKLSSALPFRGFQEPS